MRVAMVWGQYEGPTWCVAAAIYAGWGLLTWFYHDLPLWFILPAAAWLVCWHGSLQHETIHGHPTRNPLVNELVGSPALGLFIPYRLYKMSHLRHHHDERLTFPFEDPESYYVDAKEWKKMGALRRRLLLFYNTLFGRLTIGPPLNLAMMARDEINRLRRGERDHVDAWLLHIPAVAIVLYWVCGVCNIPLLSYILFFAWPGLSLTMLRSFAEHRAVDEVRERTVIVQTTPWMRLLYLNNNFHSVHHDYPRLAWYQIPARFRAHRDAFLKDNGHYYFSCYGEQFRRYLFRAKELPVHPGRS